MAKFRVILWSMCAWALLPGVSAMADEIHEAAKAGDAVKMRALLDAQPHQVNARDEQGLTPLGWAAFYNRKDTVELLLAHKADVNVRDNDGQTPLHLAAHGGSHAVAELLLEHHADINARDNNGRTPLHAAAHLHRVDMARLLVEKQADVNVKDKKGITPLDVAIKSNRDVISNQLRQHGGMRGKDLHHGGHPPPKGS